MRISDWSSDVCSSDLHMFLGAAHDANARRTRWVVLLTAVMMVGEIAAGYVTGSMALLADGFHMATHAGALSIAAPAYAYARRHARHPDYSSGTGKVRDPAALAPVPTPRLSLLVTRWASEIRNM